MDKKTTAGHITALVTIMIWGTTFISTKNFTPIEILFFRFLFGLLVLSIIYLKRLKIKDKKQELTFAAAGLCGIYLISFNGKDLEGNAYMGIIQFPVLILTGNTEILKKLRTKLFGPQFAELTVVDFSDL